MSLAAGVTDVGRTRSSNEDAFVTDTDLGLFAVADGMGGHQAGEVASRLAIDTLVSFVRASRTDSGITWPFGFDTTLSFEANQLRSGIQLANQQIRYEAQRHPEYDGMGSTIVALLVWEGRYAWAGVGDSRLYRFRRGALEQLTVDDSWAASMQRAGASLEAIEQHAMRHVLTRALGTATSLDIRVESDAVDQGDLLLLCSDGLYGPLGDEGLRHLLGGAAASTTPDVLAAALVEAANRAGGPDNVTAVVLRPEPARHRLRRRLHGESGQTAAEYLVAAGMLAAVGIAATALLVPALRDLVRGLAHALSVPAP